MSLVRQEDAGAWHAIRLATSSRAAKIAVATAMLKVLKPVLRRYKTDAAIYATRADTFSSKVNLCRVTDRVEHLFACTMEELPQNAKEYPTLTFPGDSHWTVIEETPQTAQSSAMIGAKVEKFSEGSFNRKNRNKSKGPLHISGP